MNPSLFIHIIAFIQFVGATFIRLKPSSYKRTEAATSAIANFHKLEVADCNDLDYSSPIFKSYPNTAVWCKKENSVLYPTIAEGSRHAESIVKDEDLKKLMVFTEVKLGSSREVESWHVPLFPCISYPQNQTDSTVELRVLWQHSGSINGRIQLEIPLMGIMMVQSLMLVSSLVSTSKQLGVGLGLGCNFREVRGRPIMTMTTDRQSYSYRIWKVDRKVGGKKCKSTECHRISSWNKSSVDVIGNKVPEFSCADESAFPDICSWSYRRKHELVKIWRDEEAWH